MERMPCNVLLPLKKKIWSCLPECTLFASKLPLISCPMKTFSESGCLAITYQFILTIFITSSIFFLVSVVANFCWGYNSMSKYYSFLIELGTTSPPSSVVLFDKRGGGIIYWQLLADFKYWWIKIKWKETEINKKCTTAESDQETIWAILIWPKTSVPIQYSWTSVWPRKDWMTLWWLFASRYDRSLFGRTTYLAKEEDIKYQTCKE